MVVPYWIGRRSYFRPIMASLPTHRSLLYIYKSFRNVQKNGNWSVCGNIGKPSTLHAEYFRKPKPNTSEYVSMYIVCNQICTDPRRLKSNVRLTRTSIKMTKWPWRLCEFRIPIANSEHFPIANTFVSSAPDLFVLFQFVIVSSCTQQHFCSIDGTWTVLLTWNRMGGLSDWLHAKLQTVVHALRVDLQYSDVKFHE
jgi:hypothetical protein